VITRTASDPVRLPIEQTERSSKRMYAGVRRVFSSGRILLQRILPLQPLSSEGFRKTSRKLDMTASPGPALELYMDAVGEDTIVYWKARSATLLP